MATLDYEDRKRPLDADHGAAKADIKRPHLDRSASSYISNGGTPFALKEEVPADGDEDVSPAYKGLEAYRKEAIYRKMREAQRDLARSEAKVLHLQARMSTAEERVAAMNQFWNTLVEDIQLLVKEGRLPAEQHSALIDAMDLTLRQPSTSAFTLSLQERNASLKAVLGLVVSLAPGSSPEIDELQSRSHRLAEDSAALRARLARTDEERHDLIEELNLTVEQLRRMERLHDRYHSKTVKSTERPGAQKEEEAEQARAQAAEAEKQAALRRKEQADGVAQGATVGRDSDQASAAIAEEAEEARSLAMSRLQEVEKWRDQFATVRRENEELRAQLQDPSPELVASSNLYRDVHAMFESARRDHEQIKSLNERLEVENVELRERRQEFEALTQGEANKLLDDLRSAAKTQEADVARMRVQRDDAQAELAERKARDIVKSNQIEEVRALVNAKDLRIKVLSMEVRRLQSSWAAHNGDTALLQRLKQEGEGSDTQDDISLISDLQSRLKVAEEKAGDLERQLAAHSSNTTEGSMVKRIADLEKEIAELIALFEGVVDDRDALPTADAIKSLMKAQRQETEQLRLELATASTHTTALCDELEKLGAAYAEAQKLAAARIADAGRMEEKVSRLATEKAKADNKYFSAMRAKDSIDNERRAAVRNVERKTVALEQYAEMEKKWTEHLRKQEADLTALRHSLADANRTNATIEVEKAKLTEALQAIQAAQLAASEQSRRQTEEYMQENRQRVAAQERSDKLQRELEKARKQLSSNGGSRKKSIAEDDEVGDLKRLVFCSACHDRIRDRIIVRCLHTFCHDCVDARIQTRQRKCPSCGLGFSTSDVQALYFQ